MLVARAPTAIGVAGWPVTLQLWLYLSGRALGKGRSNVRIDEPAPTATYPSQVRRKYYTYYIAYFTPSGLFYAKTGRSNARTVSTCENYEPYFDNQTFLGRFPCPMEKDPHDFKHCCGKARLEYCCRLVDTTSFRLALGLGLVGAIAVIIVIIVCVCLSAKSSRKAAKAKKDIKRQMLQMGIPKYGTKSTSRYVATQSEDGYMIVVRFKKDMFYDEFWAQLRNRYASLAWRYSDDNGRKEVKVTNEDGSWANVVLQDGVHGRPQMTVIREKAAVEWMDSVFEELCAQIPDDGGICPCMTRKKQVHPLAKTTPAAPLQERQSKYEMKRSKVDSGEKSEPKY